MVSLIRLVTVPPTEWEKAREKGKPPKPKADTFVLQVIADALTQRLEKYPTTIEVRFARVIPTLRTLLTQAFQLLDGQRAPLRRRFHLPQQEARHHRPLRREENTQHCSH